MIRYLIEKEFKLIARDALMPRMILLMPIMMMIILPFAANLEVHNIDIAIVDNDRSPSSRQMGEKISASEYFNLIHYGSSYQEAMRKIENGTADIILEIPPHFEKDMGNGMTPNLRIAANAVNAINASMGSNYITSIIGSLTAGSSTSPIQITPQFRFNPTLNYKFFMVPALMVMLLNILCGFMPALNIVSEKESGTIEQMNVTPVGKFAFIFSKILPYWVIGFIVLTICFVIAYLFYGLMATGSYLTIYASAMLFILTVSGLGLVISNYSSTMSQAMFMMFFFMLIMILLSGLFTPIQSMPMWAERLTIFNPFRYFVQIMRGVYLKGSTLSDIAPQLGALSCFAAVLYGWAIVSYRKKN